MKNNRSHSPLLGYNTNVRHDGILFHIQTEDSGVDRPHIITHLFTEGTILATKKTGYADLVGEKDIEERVRGLMKQQHRAMFIELRDGVHDDKASRILARPASSADQTRPEAEMEAAKANTFAAVTEETKAAAKRCSSPEPVPVQPAASALTAEGSGVRVIAPAEAKKNVKRASKSPAAAAKKAPSARSIFDTPDENGEFGEDLISDKSLDEVILSYLTEDDID